MELVFGRPETNDGMGVEYLGQTQMLMIFDGAGNMTMI